MRKRERENPCGICGHYHKYEEGEPCGVCGHRPPAALTGAQGAGSPRQQQESAFPSEILREFLFLGSYDNASRSELLKTLGISHILNTVPFCQNLYRNSFTYHCLQDDKTLQFDDAIQFLEQCERDKARVLVHCMSGKSRSAAFVIAFLMKSRGWRLAQCFQWVKERRPQVQLADAAQQQLIEYEQKLFGSNVWYEAGANAWEESRGLSFMYDGVPLLAMLDEYVMLREEREEEKKRMKEQKRYVEQKLSTDHEGPFGSRVSPNRPATAKKLPGPKSNGTSVNGTPPSRRLSINGRSSGGKDSKRDSLKAAVPLSPAAANGAATAAKEDTGASHVSGADLAPTTP